MQITSSDGPLRYAARILQDTTQAARQQQTLRRAIRRMPTPVPWDWASRRLIPLLAGPRFDEPGRPLVRRRSELGPAVEFGLDLGGVFVMVDQPVADRWECTADQLNERGLRNLRERTARIDRDRVVSGVMSGYPIRLIHDRPAWASSILLDLDSVVRLFGSHDQVLAAPTARCVVSLPIDTPGPIAAGIVVDLEGSGLTSLFLDPFVLADGVLSWAGAPRDGEEEDADWTS